jgi:glycine/D-amino acid oxidase-like deaminating enzyme
VHPPERAQVAIVGGGLAGLATAWALAERGVGDVVVLERGPALATHASGKNAAMCRALAEDDPWTALTAAGAALLRSPPPSLAAASLVDDRGAALLTRAPSTLAALAGLAGRHRVRCQPLEPARLAGWRSLAIPAAAGLWCPDDGVIELAALVAALAGAARRAGARIRCDVDVEAVRDPDADGDVVLETSTGPVRATTVVNAAGAWAGELGVRLGAGDPGYQARRRHVFALALAPADPGAPIVWDVDEREWYVRPAGPEVWASACDTAVAAPGDVEPRTTAFAELRDRLPPAFAAASLRRAWACQRTFSPAGAPVIARDPARPWLCWVAGLGGHGVTASLAVGRRAAAAILD